MRSRLRGGAGGSEEARECRKGTVALLARRREPLEELAAALRDEGVDAGAFPADVSDPDGLRTAPAAAEERFGGIDVREFSPAPSRADLRVRPLIDASEVTVESVVPEFDMYIRGGVSAVRQVLPGVLSRGTGTIIFTTGAGSGPMIFPHVANVQIATGGLRNWALNLHASLAGRGVYRLELADRIDDGATFDYIVCGAGSSGSVLAGRLAADPAVTVLFVESGADDDERVRDPDLWPANLGSERTWDHVTEANQHLNGRRLAYATGRGLGGGGAVNAGVWARGHRSDWDSFAEAAGDPAWGYAHVLEHYRGIEDWQGAPDPGRRGTSGPMRIRPSQDVHPLFTAFLDGAEAIGISRFDSANGALMETGSGCAVRDENIHNGVRQTPFRRYVADRVGQPNLTVLPHTTVSRVLLGAGRACGVELVRDGRPLRVNASQEVVLSLGALGTPPVLMRSGIGDEGELRALGIPVVQHLPGVGRNLDDHIRLPCMWEATDVPLPVPTRSQAVCFWEDETRPGAPEFVMYVSPAPSVSPESAAQYPPPERCFTLMPAMRLRGGSRGRVRLASTDPLTGPRIETNFLADPDDLRSALSAVAMAREVGNSAALRPFVRREVSPAPPGSSASFATDTVELFVRNAVETYWHQSGTSRMGRDEGAVVDVRLKVHGIEGLRVADASVLPHVTVANTMAPSMVVGERAAEILAADHG